MKKLFLLFILVIQLNAAILETNILSVDENHKTATIKAPNIKNGMSGFIVHYISPNHSVILNSIEVSNYNTNTSIATLKITPYTLLDSKALPKPLYTPKKADKAILAYGYNKALLIAPTEDIYYKINKSVKIEWIDPDIFASILSANGHPTPLKEDFEECRTIMRFGLIFLYLDNHIYTLDAKSFKILAINDAKLKEKDIKLPFYSRVDKIEANWFGEGSDYLKEYDPYYYELLVQFNNKNKKLKEIIKSSKYSDLLDQFEEN